MAQMNISIPEALKAWAERRVAEGRYASTSDYIRDLVRKDQDGAEKAVLLRREIEEGFASGFDDRDHSDIIEEVISHNRAKHG